MKVDWQQLALNLRKHGALRSFSEGLNVNRDYLGQLSRNEIAEPKFSVGVALLNLHLDLCGSQKTAELYRG